MSTGKTTLFTALRAHFGPRLRYTPEASRAVASEFGLATTEDWATLLGDASRLDAFFSREEEWLKEQLQGGGPTLVDSSHYVIAAYRAHFGAPPTNLSLRYDLILYCPPSFPPADDGFRFTQGREDVDRHLGRLLALSELGHVMSLPTGDDRMPAAIGAIESVLEQTNSHASTAPRHGSGAEAGAYQSRTASKRA